MRRTARLLAVGLPPVLALGVAATPAYALDPLDAARAMLVLETSASFSGGTVTYTANATFVGGLIPNSVVTINAVGTEVYTDSRGVVLTAPVECHSVSVRFDSHGTAQCTAYLKSADSIVVSDWTAEAVGIAPGVFMGQCVGTANRLDGGTTFIYAGC